MKSDQNLEHYIEIRIFCVEFSPLKSRLLFTKGIIVLLCKLICNAIIGQDCGDGVNKDNVILRTENSLNIVD